MLLMKEVVIVSGARTPIGDYLGALKNSDPIDVACAAAAAAIQRSGLGPKDIDEVILGQTVQAGCGGNPARQVQFRCGIPMHGPSACTVNQQCASAMRALEIGVQQITLGKTGSCLVAGLECMSSTPYILKNARQGYRLGNPNDLFDIMVHDGLHCGIAHYHMGLTAENLAEKYGISREEQDFLALMSHTRAVAAVEEGKFKEEIAAVEIKTKKGTAVFDTDEHPNPDTALESLSQLPPVFKKGGTVTAGNSSSLNDGAAAVVIMDGDKAKEMGIKASARVLSTANFGVDPGFMGIGPAYAIPRALEYAGLHLEDVDLFEINEAFAAQFLAVNRELGLDLDRVNVNGSGIGLGHPTGSTGIRLVVTLMHELKRRNARYGAASLCSGGGPSAACIIESI
jgi:acetyl-CoA C-acetyltransferase